MLVERTAPLEPASPRRWNLTVVPLCGLLLAAVASLGQPLAASEEHDAQKPEAIAPAESTPAPAATRAGTPAQSTSAAAGKLSPGDIVSIEAITDLTPDAGVRLLLPPSFTASVDGEGKLSLGGHYQVPSVGGMSLREAEKKIAEVLSQGLELDVKRKQLEDEEWVPPRGKIQLNVRASLEYSGPDLSLGDSSDRTTPPAAANQPKRIAPGDVLHMELAGATERELADVGLRSVVVVESDGSVALGALHGRVNLLGRSLVEAEKIVDERLAKTIQEPNVQLTYERPGASSTSRVRELEHIIQQLTKELRQLKSAAIPGTGRDIPLRFSLVRDLTGQVLLYLDGHEVDDQVLAGLRARADEGDSPVVLLTAQKGVSYADVVKTIDRLAQAGVTRLSLDTQHVDRNSK